MLRRIIALIKKEFLSIWKDPRSRTLIIVPPILQLLIFAHAATMEVRNLNMAVLDNSKTLQSRELITKFEHSKWFRKIIIVDNQKQVEKLISSKKAHLALLIDDDFSTNLKKKKPTQLQLILDGRQTNVAGIASGYVNTIVSQYENENFPRKNAPQISVQVRNWFNPNLIFLWYTVVSLITILATTIALILTALSIAREREMGTFDQLIVSPLNSFEILVGKTAPPLIISVVLTTIMGVCAILLFDVPFKGSIGIFYIGIIIYLLSMVGIGLFISSICKTQQQAILGAFAFQMPAILLSGYISPIEDMPLFFQYLTWGNPVRFFLVIIKGITFKNMPMSYIIENMIPLSIIGLITLFAAGWMFKKNLD